MPPLPRRAGKPKNNALRRDQLTGGYLGRPLGRPHKAPTDSAGRGVCVSVAAHMAAERPPNGASAVVTPEQVGNDRHGAGSPMPDVIAASHAGLADRSVSYVPLASHTAAHFRCRSASAGEPFRPAIPPHQSGRSSLAGQLKSARSVRQISLRLIAGTRAHPRPRQWLWLAGDGCASCPLAATAQPKVSSPGLRPFLARQETPVCGVLHCVPAHHPFGLPNGTLSACSACKPLPETSHRGRE